MVVDVAWGSYGGELCTIHISYLLDIVCYDHHTTLKHCLAMFTNPYANRLIFKLFCWLPMLAQFLIASRPLKQAH